MVEVVVAVLGLLGAVAGSAAISDWLRRRAARGRIVSDLDVWRALPEGPVKDELLSRIEERVNGLSVAPSETRRRWIVGMVGAFTFGTAITVAQFIGGHYSFERHSDGILWLHTPQGPLTTLPTALMWYVAAPIVLAYLMAIGWNYTIGDVIDGVRRLAGRWSTNPTADEDSPQRPR